jgi:hypothetical protein
MNRYEVRNRELFKMITIVDVGSGRIVLGHFGDVFEAQELCDALNSGGEYEYR